MNNPCELTAAVVSERYEHGSIILTSTKSYEE